ncbi:MAG: hypothetical protein LBT11_01280 [Treponema sp.]|jgi:hypothetical protein|nr:hypothetical protein [Treponema sp.]
MKILQLKDLVRTDSPIYYRRFYSGTVSLDLMGKELDRRIDFTVETMPAGNKEISITALEEVDYPKLPLMQEIKGFIAGEDARGALPV